MIAEEGSYFASSTMAHHQMRRVRRRMKLLEMIFNYSAKLAMKRIAH